MESLTLTNLLLTGILLVQCFAVIFRAPAQNNNNKKTNNPQRFP